MLMTRSITSCSTKMISNWMHYVVWCSLVPVQVKQHHCSGISDLYFSESEYVYFAGLWWGTTCTPIEKSGFWLTWAVDMLSVFGSKNYGRQRQSIANLLGCFMFASKLSDNQKKPVTTVMNSKATKSFPGYMPRICNWPSPMQRDSIQLSKWDL